MATDFIKDQIKVNTKADALKLHIMIKCFQRGFNLSHADVDTLVELHESGYNTGFFRTCVSKGYYKSEQTVRNAVAKMTGLGILSYRKRGERVISSEYIPETKSDKVMIQYLVGNLK